MQSPQDRRLKPLTAAGENNQQQPPQKCPRCDSVNTKFCYYNNYSLSQPRYFCKSCRRYWTQGGTLRNVPVGGGCRKGKRSKVSSSGENPRSSQPQTPVQPQQQQAQQQTVISCSLASSPPGVSSVGSLYPSGGFLSSLAAIQSMNHHHQPFGGGSSNLGLLQGYGVPSSFGAQVQQHQQIQQTQLSPLIYQDDNSCHQSFINNSNPTISEAALWSISSNNNTGGNTGSGKTTGAGSLNPSQWSDLSGYSPT